MTAVDFGFYYLAVACVVSALFAVTRANPVHAVLWVLALFLHVAGIYLLSGAEFLAAAQVIVYAGAILVFYLIVLMILDLRAEQDANRFGPHWPWGAAAGAGFVLLVARALRSASFPSGPEVGPATVAELGEALYGRFALPFELASLVLLAAIVGAVVLARPRRPA